MLYKKYIYKDDKIKLVLEEDNKEVGWYLIIYNDPNSEKSMADYLYDSEDIAFKIAEKKFGIKKEQWILIQ